MNAQRYWTVVDFAFRALPHSERGFVVEYFDRKSMMWQLTNIVGKSVAECKRETAFIFGSDIPDHNVEIRVIYPE